MDDSQTERYSLGPVPHRPNTQPARTGVELPATPDMSIDQSPSIDP